VYLRPLEHGADFALHSSTKFLAGGLTTADSG
jgi:cystathionine beta-lyase/cystathionine gamma-synthase